MRLMLPANYDVGLLAHLKALDVFEVYGKLPYDVGAAHEAGLEFNYLLNASCLGDREWSKPFHRRLHRLLDWLTEIEVNTVTVVLPFLLQLIKERHPHFKVKVGIYAQVDTLKRARCWEDLGADAINLESLSINRDFEKLARIREAVQTDLILIANHFCQPNRPYKIQQQSGFAHASGNRRRFLIDCPLLQCNFHRFSDPTVLISSGWIRPRDLHYYEEMGHETFKLIERNIPSEALLERAQAYSARRYDGNLAELLFSWGFKRHPPRFSWLHFARTFGLWNVHPSRMGLVKRFLELQGIFFTYTQDMLPVVIDTNAIPDNFLDTFRAIPGSMACSDLDCDECGTCAAMAEKAVRIDPEFLDAVLPLYREIESLLVSGSFWNVASPACC